MKRLFVLRAAGTAFLLAYSSASFASVCQYADKAYAKIATGVVGAGVATGATIKAAGITAVAHAAGPSIATGSAGYIGGTMGAGQPASEYLPPRPL